MKNVFAFVLFLLLSSSCFGVYIRLYTEAFGGIVSHRYLENESYSVTSGLNSSHGFGFGLDLPIKNTTLSVGSGLIFDRKSYEYIRYGTADGYPQTVDVQYAYGYIPLRFRYSIFSDRKVSPYVSFILTRSGRYDEQILTTDSYGVQNEFEPNQYHDKDNHGRVFQYGAGASWEIWKRFSLWGEIFYKKRRATNYLSSNIDEDSYTAYGVWLGVRYNFKPIHVPK